MKTILSFVLAIGTIGTLSAPALSFAQSDRGPITREQVRAELIQLEQAGYNISSGEDANYPADVQAAEAKVAAGSDASQAISGVGGVASGGTSESGARMQVTPATVSTCVGPASYCATYFGN
jgi:hypothetical protein